MHQAIGNKHLLLIAIQHPVFSAAQPDEGCSSRSAEQIAAMLQRFMTAWEEEKESEVYKKDGEIRTHHTGKNRFQTAGSRSTSHL